MKTLLDMPAVIRAVMSERLHVSYRLNATLGRNVWRPRNAIVFH